jgi:hypothetical protein
MIGFERFEAELGLALPAPYKELVSTYGQGIWFQVVHVLSPFYAWLNGLEPWFYGPRGYAGGPSWCARLRECREKFPDDFIYPIYPEPGGVFPWAFTEDEGVLYWLTEGPAETWPTLFGGQDTQEHWERYDLSVTQLLWGIAANDSSVVGTSLAQWLAPYRSYGFVALK